MAPQSRGVRTLFVSTLVLTAALSACDQPTQVEPVLDPAFARASPPLTTVSCAGTDIEGRKNVQVKVLLSTGGNGDSAVVTLISKQHGPQCYGRAKTDGIVLFTNVAQGAEIFVTARDEVTEAVARLETIPPAIPGNLLVFDDTPSLPGNRQVPVLLSGTACTTASSLSWTNWSSKYATPCVVPGAGLSLTVRFDGNAPKTDLTLLDPEGSPLQNVIVAALSPWAIGADSAAQALACLKTPWVADCNKPSLSSGPALIQSADLTSTTGFVSLGHANTTPIVLEAITEDKGLTFFGTVTEGIGGTGTVQMAPGMCTIDRVLDVMDSSVPDVDIKYTEHSVGMSWSAEAEPTPINHSLIVRAEVYANNAGGAGRYDLSWLIAGSPSRSVRADFSIPEGGAKFCSPFGWSGNGLSGVAVKGYCAKSADQDSAAVVSRTAYTLYFIVYNLTTPIADAFYTLNTVGDGVDPSKSSNTRAAISFNGDPAITTDDTLNRTSCPVPVNNDGRFGTFRLGSNDGRFGTF